MRERRKFFTVSFFSGTDFFLVISSRIIKFDFIFINRFINEKGLNDKLNVFFIKNDQSTYDSGTNPFMLCNN